MTASSELLDRFKQVRGITSDYAAAKALEVTRAAVSQWRTGSRHMDDATVAFIARELRIDAAAAIAQVNLDKPLTKRERAIWETYCARVCVAALVALASTATPIQGRASQFLPDAGIVHVGQLIDYAHLTVSRFARAVHRWLETAFRAIGYQRLRAFA